MNAKNNFHTLSFIIHHLFLLWRCFFNSKFVASSRLNSLFESYRHFQKMKQAPGLTNFQLARKLLGFSKPLQ